MATLSGIHLGLTDVSLKEVTKIGLRTFHGRLLQVCQINVKACVLMSSFTVIFYVEVFPDRHLISGFHQGRC